QRLDNWPQHYPWVDQEGYAYFRKRLTEARRDVEHGLQITLDWYKTREQQDRMIKILQFKLDVLWTMADAMYMAYINEMSPYFNVGNRL
ncbi:MAG TPA: pyrroloquinoline quinone biosynthesis protein C, partial [Cytophagales bacterium]|nr:pyrroloquinoline quinone biosynthesis protein C [Cytophagales bacterium]